MSRIWLLLASASSMLLPATASADPTGLTMGSEGRGIDTGVFMGGTFYGDSIDLGNANPSFDDQAPNPAFSIGLRGATTVIDSLLKGSPLAPRLSVEGEMRLALASMPGDEMNGRASYGSPVLGWRVHGLVSIWPSRKITPFLVLGLGGETIFTSSPFASNKDTDVNVYWGLGGTYDINEKMGVRLDLRHGIAAARPSGLTSTLETNVGFFYRFRVGGSRGPRIGKKVIATRPESKPDPYLEPKPAPKVDVTKQDRDKDGILDGDDKCPDDKETPNNIDDEDGCPEVDSDSDGLVGSKDKCPNEAEDIDGFEDDDGCPDRDNDGDGRPDVIDQCPLQPETLNGYKDSDGCPDTVPAPIKKYTGVLPAIQFAGGSARIVRRSRRTLNGIVTILKKYPTLRISVEGHTDSRGKPLSNRKLSRKRADAVKWYLVDKGVLRARITTVGFGPDKPIATNKTWRGRKKNRRIEIKLLPGAATIPDPRASSGAAPAPAPVPAATPPAAVKKAPAAPAKPAKKKVPAAKAKKKAPAAKAKSK